MKREGASSGAGGRQRDPYVIQPQHEPISMDDYTLEDEPDLEAILNEGGGETANKEIEEVEQEPEIQEIKMDVESGDGVLDERTDFGYHRQRSLGAPVEALL